MWRTRPAGSSAARAWRITNGSPTTIQHRRAGRRRNIRAAISGPIPAGSPIVTVSGRVSGEALLLMMVRITERSKGKIDMN
jgi:hypothetical protein